MINIDEMIPRYYNKRDFKLFFKLLEYLLNSIKKDIDYKVKIMTPENCPNEFLDLLGSRVSYRYRNIDITDGIDINRFITKYYYQLRKDRGSIKGVLEAVRLVQNYLNNNSTESKTTIDVFEDPINLGSYIVVVDNAKLSPIIKEVIDIVRPVGFTYNTTEYSNDNKYSNILISDKFDHTTISIRSDRSDSRSEVSENTTSISNTEGVIKINNVEDYKSFEGQVDVSEVSP